MRASTARARRGDQRRRRGDGGVVGDRDDLNPSPPRRRGTNVRRFGDETRRGRSERPRCAAQGEKAGADDKELSRRAGDDSNAASSDSRPQSRRRRRGAVRRSGRTRLRHRDGSRARQVGVARRQHGHTRPTSDGDCARGRRGNVVARWAHSARPGPAGSGLPSTRGCRPPDRDDDARCRARRRRAAQRRRHCAASALNGPTGDDHVPSKGHGQVWRGRALAAMVWRGCARNNG